MNGKRLRPMMDDYLQSDNKPQNNSNSNTGRPPAKDYNNQPNTQNQQNQPTDPQPVKQRFFNPNKNSDPVQTNNTNFPDNKFSNNYEENKFHHPQENKQSTNSVNTPQNNKGNMHEIYGEPHLHRTSQSHSINYLL